MRRGPVDMGALVGGLSLLAVGLLLLADFTDVLDVGFAAMAPAVLAAAGATLLACGLAQRRD